MGDNKVVLGICIGYTLLIIVIFFWTYDIRWISKKRGD